MSKIKAAIIGCSNIGRRHLDRLLGFKDVELVGFCSRTVERAEFFVSLTGKGRAFSEHREMLDTVRPDAVYVCVPPYAHGDIEYDLIVRHIPFYVEKPVALDMQTAAEIRERAARADLLISVGFQDRYLDVLRPVREHLVGKKPVLAVASWVGEIPPAAWWRKRELSGGQIVEQSIHLIDLGRDFFGEADSVYCASGRGFINELPPETDIDEASSAVITFRNGTILMLCTACHVHRDGAGWKNGMLISTPELRISYELRSSAEIKYKDRSFSYNRLEDQLKTASRAFLDAVISGDGSGIRSPYADACRSLEIALACSESTRTGQRVLVGQS